MNRKSTLPGQHRYWFIITIILVFMMESAWARNPVKAGVYKCGHDETNSSVN